MKELEIKKNNLYTLFQPSRLLKNYFCLVNVNDLITEILFSSWQFSFCICGTLFFCYLRYKEPPVITRIQI